MKPHNYSGWPGAFCLDCGAEDPREICAGEHSWPACKLCGGASEETAKDCHRCCGTGVEAGCGRLECEPGPCPGRRTQS